MDSSWVQLRKCLLSMKQGLYVVFPACSNPPRHTSSCRAYRNVSDWECGKGTYMQCTCPINFQNLNLRLCSDAPNVWFCAQDLTFRVFAAQEAVLQNFFASSPHCRLAQASRSPRCWGSKNPVATVLSAGKPQNTGLQIATHTETVAVRRMILLLLRVLLSLITGF